MDRLIGSGSGSVKVREIVSTLKNGPTLTILLTTAPWTNLADALDIDGTVQTGLKMTYMMNPAGSIEDILKQLIENWVNKTSQPTLRKFCAILREEKYVAFAESLESQFGNEDCNKGDGIKAEGSAAQALSPENHPKLDDNELNDKRTEYVRSKLPEFIDKTILNNGTLTIFHSKHVLSQDDLDDLSAINNAGERKRKFFTIIFTRNNWFETLLQAMKDTDQTGVVDLLNKINYDK